MLLENSNQRLDASFSLRRAGYFCHVGEERGAWMRAGSWAAGTGPTFSFLEEQLILGLGWGDYKMNLKHLTVSGNKNMDGTSQTVRLGLHTFTAGGTG